MTNLKGLLMLGAALSVGCAALPERQATMPTLPQSFLAEGGSVAPTAWWHAFSDPDLDQLIAQALAENLSLQATAARLRAAEAVAGAAAAGLRPSLTARASATHNEGGETTGSTSLSAAYELDLWGRLRSSRDAAVLQAEATAQELHAARISLSAAVAIQWFALGSSGERLQLISQERATYERLLRLVESRYRNGQANVSDVLRQRQLVESTRSLEASTAAELGTQRHALEELLGQPAGSRALAGNIPPAMSALPRSGLPADVVSRRPDVQQRWLLLQSADRSVAAAIANRFPQLSLTASGTSSDAGASRLFEDWLGSLVANLVGPIFDGGARRAEVERTRAVFDQRLAEYRSAVLVGFREIQDALLRDQQQTIRVASLIEQLRLSDAVIERIERQLRNGSATYLSLLDAQITNSSLRREVLSARQQHAEQRIALFRAMAGPLADEEELVVEPVDEDSVLRQAFESAHSVKPLSPLERGWGEGRVSSRPCSNQSHSVFAPSSALRAPRAESARHLRSTAFPLTPTPLPVGEGLRRASR
ncbi:efflux transporter outer membrane subunit [Pseudomarimonas arenosa]|uniref:Efflux transporter outer membrane subunit n=1 Tax=Pseudomarimonas arenosa TaxID=2774145 RepID=A0AAW3ZS27_9GAMM|nr:efflux transporter outer membrane subunit [Pseudomarimonas arenosa]MBD8527874.1 efflux transporter outer membrane subunit [Pseudomarimonas arenosa]